MNQEINHLKQTMLENLEKYEAIIEKTKGSFIECGAALGEIRNKGLYRIRCRTFEKYCRERWSWGRNYANKIISASAFIADLVTTVPILGCKGANLGTVVTKVTERQARELRKLPKDRAQKIATEIISTEKTITAKTIQTIARDVSPQPQLDDYGHIVPDLILEDWNRAKRIGNELLKLTSSVKCMIEARNTDLIFAETTTEIFAMSQNLYSYLRCIIPHAICPSCSGVSRELCRLCKKRGFLSKFAWKTFVPIEIRSMHENGHSAQQNSSQQIST